MSLSDFIDLAVRSVAEMPAEFWVVSGLLIAFFGTFYLLRQLWRGRTHARLGLLTRGLCSECAYHPDAGTKVCPECGSQVLDMRLFRPVRRPEDAPPA